MKQFLLGALMFLALVANAAAQTLVQGRVTDAETGEGVIGANVSIKGTTIGAMTDVDGKFSFKAEEGTKVLVISFVGYETVEKALDVKGSVLKLGSIVLKASSIGLNEVEIIADVAIDRKTPVAVSSIKLDVIEEKLGTQEFPEVLKSTPGVYATKGGGGFGDSRINLRGFDSDNIGVLINGVPVNDMESGKVYWSNWAGLADVTSSMQVQRGLGASKLAIPSAGGTINIITKGTDAKKGGSIGAWIGNDGYAKQMVTLSTGLLDNGWAVTFSGSRTSGDGYINGTAYKGYSYFLSIGKEINENHDLVFTVFGAPQKHGQRSTFYSKQYFETYERFGKKYNPDYGYRGGELLNSSENEYHKPQMSLNHYWTISDRTDLSTSAYASIGKGGSTSFSGDRSKYPTSLYSSTDAYRTPDGLINFDKIEEENKANGHLGSSVILKDSRNNHVWIGLLSSLNHQFSDNLVFNGGVDFRYYRGEHYSEVKDLLGGEFFIDDKDVNSPNKVVRKGDKISYSNDGVVLWEGVFGQLEYTRDALAAFVSGSVNNTSYKRIDYFKYTKGNQKTSFQNFLAYSIKGGANYNLTDIHNVFFNAGYFTRAPRFRGTFLNYSNVVNKDIENEKILSIEMGYGLRTDVVSLNANAYWTKWMDKSLRVSGQADRVNAEGNVETVRVSGNVLGVDALHRGLELDFIVNPVEALEIRGMASLGFWEWQSDIRGVELFDDDQNKLPSKVDILLDGVKVSDAAQTTYSLGTSYEPLKGLKIGADYNYFGNLYAYMKIDQNAANGKTTWEMPAYSTLDANVKYSFDLVGLKATLYGKVNNLLDTEYISDAQNGMDYDAMSSTVFYGFGRTWSMGLKFKF
ncbi:MAG: TonB-dependent receptor [Cytophagales bacterium]|nr:TonB-dependent receptor [Cytophagales bacterium]